MFVLAKYYWNREAIEEAIARANRMIADDSRLDDAVAILNQQLENYDVPTVRREVTSSLSTLLDSKLAEARGLIKSKDPRATTVMAFLERHYPGNTEVDRLKESFMSTVSTMKVS